MQENQELNEVIEGQEREIQKLKQEIGSHDQRDRVIELQDELNLLLGQNQELATELKRKDSELECVHELDDKIEEVVHENQQYKDMNDHLHH